MGKSMDEVVEQLKFLRMGLVPPYCENQDEDEMTVDDYRQHLAPRLQECKDAASRYLASVMRLAHPEDGDEDAATVAELLAARAQFAASFPFCADQLAGVPPTQTQSYVDYMVQTYRRDAAMGGLAKSLQQYIALLNEIG